VNSSPAAPQAPLPGRHAEGFPYLRDRELPGFQRRLGRWGDAVEIRTLSPPDGSATGTDATHPCHARRTTMQLATVAKSLALSLLLASSALSTSAFAADKVNINTADAATIDEVLLNIGPAKAEAIVAYRKANGGFKSAEQLALVKGVGLKTIEKNRDRIVVGNVAGTGKGIARKPPMTKTAARPAAKR
jgi:competence protein ComEA